MIQTKSYRVVAQELPFEHKQREKIFETFFCVSDFFKSQPIAGACHLFSSIFYVLLKEKQIEDVELCIGEVQDGDKFFDHSWIEINGEIFDIAIQLTLDERKNPPIYASYDLLTEKYTQRIYGSESPLGLDFVAQNVLKTSFVKYLNGFDRGRAWKIIKKLGKEISLKLDEKELQKKYTDTKRKFVNHRRGAIDVMALYNEDGE